MSDIESKIKVTITPSDYDYEFWGKKSSDILAMEFGQFLGRSAEESEFFVFISQECPLVDRAFVLELISQMGDYSSIRTSDGRLMITRRASTRKHEKILNSNVVLKATVNRERVEISEKLRSMIVNRHIEAGVFILDPKSAYIDFDAEIESGVTIYPNNTIRGKSVIKSGCVLMPNNNITSSSLDENVTVAASTLNGASVGKNCTIGPNAYLRPNARIGEDCRIGDFVEIKNSTIGNNTKVSHLAYVGDAIVGENCNIGCGAIFVNYNGKTKSTSVVGNNCFIGSNCNIIAPVTIGDSAYIAAGTTVTKDLPEDAFCIGRVRQEIKENLASKYLK